MNPRPYTVNAAQHDIARLSSLEPEGFKHSKHPNSYAHMLLKTAQEGEPVPNPSWKTEAEYWRTVAGSKCRKPSEYSWRSVAQGHPGEGLSLMPHFTIPSPYISHSNLIVEGPLLVPLYNPTQPQHFLGLGLKV